MLKRTLIVLCITVALVVAIQPIQPAYGVLMTSTEALMSSSPDTPAVDQGQTQGSGESAFISGLKAPFKAIGRLFGRGKKDDNKLHRLSEKDVKKFESAEVTRVTDATSAPAPATSNPELSPQEHLEVGRTLLNLGNLNEAISELSLAGSLDPKLAEAHNLLGVAYERKGLSELARQSFERALKINKNDAQTLNNLGYLLYSNGDYKGALDRLKKAEHQAPNDARILNNLALAQSKMGKFDDAYKSFVRAGGEIAGRLNMANRLELAGRTEEAAKQYEAAKLQAQQQQTTNDAQPIAVVMEYKNGFVISAAIRKPRPGMEAYEASALRIARQRRYPAGKNGHESIVLRVSPPPAS